MDRWGVQDLPVQPVAESIVGYSLLLLVISLVVLFSSTRLGVTLGRKRRAVADAGQEELALLVSATLILLGLLSGFSFSMAISRYDPRKNLEEEANAIGTECVRAELQRSLQSPHPESAELAGQGLEEWSRTLPTEDAEALIDTAAGKAVRWVHGEGWREDPA